MLEVIECVSLILLTVINVIASCMYKLFHNDLSKDKEVVLWLFCVLSAIIVIAVELTIL